MATAGERKEIELTVKTWRRAACGALALLAILPLAACQRRTPEEARFAIRLVDQFRPAMVKGTPAGVEAPRPIEWRFDGPVPAAAGPNAATRGWEAGPGVAALAVAGGALVGQSTTPFPVLHLATTPPADPDQLHAIEITLRASAGGNLAAQFFPNDPLDLASLPARAQVIPWRITTPLITDGQLHTYTLTPPRDVESADTRHVLIRPTDVAGARFEIRSVRLIFRREHLASIPAGVSWQALHEVYQETLVTRAPEVVSLPLQLPADPWLDLSVGTTDSRPVTFRVAVRRSGAGAAETVLEHTVTTPDRWEPTPVDLSRFAGQSVTLDLTLAGEAPGIVGLWGAPVLRRHGPWGPVAAGKGSDGPPQGVILILTDTLRRDHLQAYGYGRPTAPFLSALGQEGTVFDDCQAQATWTKAAVPSVLTSLYPSSHGVIEFTDRLPASAQTLAEVYRQQGFATLSLSSVFFTGRMTNLHQGFEELHESSSLSTPGSSKTAREYVDRLIPWLDEHRNAPFFVFLHLYDPHFPYEGYAPYDTLWANPALAAAHQGELAKVRPLIADPLLRIIGLPSRDELRKAAVDPAGFTRQNLDWYDGSVRGLDTEVGRLVQSLRALSLDRRTVVAVVADHGEEFLDHGHAFHGQTVYGELTNVPLLLWGPGRIPSGAHVPNTVETIDVMPTLIDLAGLPVPATLQGRSLAPLLRHGGEWRDRPAFSEKPAAHDALSPAPHDTQSVAVVFAGWKLIHNEIRPAGAPEFELYDHRRDPLDQHDVAAAHADVVKRLAQLLDGWRRKVRAERLKSDREAQGAMSDQDLARLRSLGYIQ